MTDIRDTKFQGFAKLLWEDATNKLEFWIDTAEPNFTEDLKQIISQYSYDLVRYAYHFVDTIDEPLTWDEILDLHLPDLKQWPPTEQER